MSSTETASTTNHVPFWIYIVFFFSGFSALVYQIVWQRSLFSIYGINIESVTVVVTAFMVGLGLGSLFGGELSKRTSQKILFIFAIIEFCTGVFGLFSLSIIHGVGNITLLLPSFYTALFTFLLLLLPTLFMGSTLPLLVTHLVSFTGNVGHSVGILYFVNTLGSAIASIAAVILLLPFLGQSDSVYAAGIINIVISIFVFLVFIKQGRNS